jgi:hypothetical protein
LLATLFLARRLVNDRSFSFPLLFLRFADQARLTDMFQRAQLWELHIEIYWAIRPHLTAYPRPDMTGRVRAANAAPQLNLGSF